MSEMSGPNREAEMLIRMGPSKPGAQESKARSTQNPERSTLLGIELPFGWCLVRGRELRAMQTDLREARQTAGIRLRMCGRLLKQIYGKESR